MRTYAITSQVDRTGEVSVSGSGPSISQYRGRGGQYRGQERLRQPTQQPGERTMELFVSSKDILKNARTMQELAQVCP
jgi:hypothetical protein